MGKINENLKVKPWIIMYILGCFMLLTSSCKHCYHALSNAGKDQLNCTTDTVMLNASLPNADETGEWSVVVGEGGKVEDIHAPSTLFIKGNDSNYSLIWAVSGPCGHSKDSLHLSFPACGKLVVEYSGERYPTVQVGNQCWLAKNLNVGMPVDSFVDQTDNQTIEKYCYLDNPINCTIYGGLYQWAEAVQYLNGANNFSTLSIPFSGNVRGICPLGWHIPNEAEFCTFLTLLDPTVDCNFYGITGTDAGAKIKSTSTLWEPPNTGANNNSGFSALPAGSRYWGGTYTGLGRYSEFWSTKEYSESSSIFYFTVYNNAKIFHYYGLKNIGISIRCMKD